MRVCVYQKIFLQLILFLSFSFPFSTEAQDPFSDLDVPADDAAEENAGFDALLKDTQQSSSDLDFPEDDTDDYGVSATDDDMGGFDISDLDKVEDVFVDDQKEKVKTAVEPLRRSRAQGSVESQLESQLGDDFDQVLEQATEKSPGQQGFPGALLESSWAPDSSVDLSDPSYALHRVPLLPPMSDKNWSKWAGPALDKIYSIRKGDTLWKVSERLFGTPYLWPKVWQLNANFGNPHVIQPRIELQFTPGNPNAAPFFGMRSKPEGEFVDIPFHVTTQKLSAMESLEAVLKHLLNGSDPPFKRFLVDSLPEELARIPKKRIIDRIFYSEGERFELRGLEDGTYNIVRSMASRGRHEKRGDFGAYRLVWLGALEVRNERAQIVRAFEEIRPGDMIVADGFDVPALSLQEVELGRRASTNFIPVDEGAFIGVSSFNAVGIRMPNREVAPRGSILTFEENGFPVGSGLVIHREGRFATVWIIESHKEIDARSEVR